MLCEAIFQTPVFIIGCYLLLNAPDSAFLPPLMLLYSSHALTTMIPCVFTILNTPGLSQDQFTMLVQAYGPWTLLSAGMVVDWFLRIWKKHGMPEEGKKKLE